MLLLLCLEASNDCVRDFKHCTCLLYVVAESVNDYVSISFLDVASVVSNLFAIVLLKLLKQYYYLFHSTQLFLYELL